jgi:hypothetical protein
MIPGGIEIATLMANTLLGGVLKIWSVKSQIAAERHERQMEIGRFQGDMVSEAREFGSKKGNSGFSWTRRTIALLCVFFIICWPKIVPVFWPECPVVISYSQFVPEGLFSTEHELTKWVVSEGLVTTPLDNMVIMSLLGLFFGHEIAKRR